jgi:hypothetical protein
MHTSEQDEEIKALKGEGFGRRRAAEVLRARGGFCATELDTDRTT